MIDAMYLTGAKVQQVWTADGPEIEVIQLGPDGWAADDPRANVESYGISDN